MSRPRNWYDMSYDEQKAWTQREREHEWETTRLEQEAQDERDARARERGAMRQREAQQREDYRNLADTYSELHDKYAQLRSYLRSKGLLAEAQAWQGNPLPEEDEA